MRVVFFLTSVLLIGIYVYIAIFHLYKVRKMDGLFIFQMMYALIYGLVPLMDSSILLFDISGYENIWNAIDISDEGIENLIIIYLLALVGFAVSFLGYYGSFGKKRREISSECKSFEKFENASRITGWICLFISFASLFLWSKAYGSIFVLILNAAAVRGGRSPVSNSLAFFKHPTKMILFCAFLFYVLWRKSTGRNRLEYFVGFFISCMGSYLYLMANDGKTTILTFLLGFIWMIYLEREIYNIPRFIAVTGLIGIIVVWMALRLDNVTAFIRHGIWNSVDRNILSVIKEFQYTVRSGQMALVARWNQHLGFTFFSDLLSGLNAWLPSKIKIGNADTIWEINTKLLYGSTSNGTSPSSLIATAYYDMGFLGILIYPFFIGKIVSVIDRYVKNQEKNPFAVALGARLMIMVFNLPGSFAMYDFTLNLFPIAMAALVYWIVNCSVVKG